MHIATSLKKIVAVSGLLVLAGNPAIAAAQSFHFFQSSTKSTAVSLTGNDVSWPQCGSKLPASQLFGIVGVNNGLANTTNPCLSGELSWALKSTGTTPQPKVAVYVNTANPGNGVADWPQSGTPNQYGTCNAQDNQACAYQYGWNMAQADAQSRGLTNPGSYKWWLDVETINSWETNKANNAADLEGMTAYFQSLNAAVGLYSTSYQWNIIAGTVSSTSDLNGLNSWLPGAGSLSGAKSYCSLPPLTSGGKVTLSQYVSRGYDYDYSCI